MKWILVTGGAIRLGASICLELASRGHAVVVHYRKHEKEAQELVENCRKWGVEAEKIAGDFDEIEDFIRRYKERFPDTKGVVNNIGNYQLAAATAIESEALTAFLSSSLVAPIALTNALVPAIKQARGRIVNLGVAGLHAVWSRAVSYGMGKAALLFYTRALAKELAAFGVTVNMVSPGQLDISVDLQDETQLPMKRAGKCDEVAYLVGELFAKESGYITGQNIEIAGGL